MGISHWATCSTLQVDSFSRREFRYSTIFLTYNKGILCFWAKAVTSLRRIMVPSSLNSSMRRPTGHRPASLEKIGIHILKYNESTFRSTLHAMSEGIIRKCWIERLNKTKVVFVFSSNWINELFPDPGVWACFIKGYSVYECRMHRMEINSLDTHIPLDIIVEIILGLLINFLFGVLRESSFHDIKDFSSN